MIGEGRVDFLDTGVGETDKHDAPIRRVLASSDQTLASSRSMRLVTAPDVIIIGPIRSPAVS
jgi:hypothetical protein